MKIGLLVCAYDCADTIKECLQPWITLQKELNIDIAIVSTPFKDFPPKDNEPTIQAMSEVLTQSTACIVTNPFPLTEHEARNMPLAYLLDQNCDFIWLLDGDEFYTHEQILKIVHRISENPFIAWWSIPFKNYILDGKHFINGFVPPRIFRVKIGKNKLKEFYWDNDVTYVTDSGEESNYKHLAAATIPASVACIRHMTWLHTNGKDKVEYQLKHFGHCSYKWNEENNELELDKEFFRSRNLPMPLILTD